MSPRGDPARKVPAAVVLVLYEVIMVFLLIGALTPKDASLAEFMADPLALMQVNETTIALALSLFLPLVLPHIKRLKIFGAEIELARKIDRVHRAVQEARRESVAHRYEQERVLYAIAASVAQRMGTRSRRAHKSLEEEPLEVGMKDFPESRILAEIMYGFFVRGKVPVNPPTLQQSTLGTFFALRSGKIDLYVEYSGNGFMLAGLEEEHHGPGEVQRRLNETYNTWGLTWLASLGFSNGHELIMLAETAARFKIVSFADLVAHAHRFVFAANQEYFLRDTEFPRLERLGLRFREAREVAIGDRYSGLFNGKFDVGVGWTTDPSMDDPRLHRITYGVAGYAMPLCRTDVVLHVKDLLASLHVSEREMRGLNKEAELAGNTPLAIRGVATGFCDQWHRRRLR